MKILGPLDSAAAAAPQLVLASASLASNLVEARHHVLPAAVVAVVFALLARRMRDVSTSGALAGAVVSFALYATAGPGAFVVLTLVFLITAATSRLGGGRKRELGIAEDKAGRNAWQILANLLTAAALSVASLVVWRAELLLAAMAALAEAAADTASSELGKAVSRKAYLITTFRPVPPGTDGGISLAGSMAGIAAAMMVAIASARWGLIPPGRIAVVAAAAVLGNLLDSVLGATLQRKGWLSNSAVNLAGTTAAAGLALVF